MAWDSNWEEVFSSRPWGKYPGEDLIRFVARRFFSAPDRSQIKILEVGSGTGANLWFIAREGFQTFGVEGSPSGVRISKERLNDEVPNWQGNIIEADILTLPFSDNEFDAVIDVEAVSCNSFDHSKKIYSEMARVLKPNGHFYSRCFSTGCDGDKSGESLGRHFYLPTTGPMAGIGPVRYTAQEDFDELLPECLADIEIDQMVLRGNLTETPILEWLVNAQKRT
ncbi:class I SAM-dependent methyltransferase [Marinomonas communis]|uniref:class I SAM-dependent methyltransferase n=1 Tax=Marinomonas communis TaxID=28254 RepID=UPI001D17F79F|nr:class I SAM-dependent methyltransferase [Marinomonas communis]